MAKQRCWISTSPLSEPGPLRLTQIPAKVQLAHSLLNGRRQVLATRPICLILLTSRSIRRSLPNADRAAGDRACVLKNERKSVDAVIGSNAATRIRCR